VGVGQGRSEGGGMRRRRQLAVGLRAQALLLDAAPHALQPRG